MSKFVKVYKSNRLLIQNEPFMIFAAKQVQVVSQHKYDHDEYFC